MTVFRINECLSNKSSNVKVVKNFKNEGIKQLVEVKGEHVGALGVIEGVFFVPDGISQNNRFYSREFWEYVLESDDVKNKLQRKIMFGRIGHQDREVIDDDLNDGKISHVVTDLWIGEDGMGYGRATILDTPAGNNLFPILAQKCDLRISSRASGDFKPGEYYQGTIPIMDESVYTLDTFDMVIYPGFIETSPKMVLNYKKENNIQNNKKYNRSEQYIKFVNENKKARKKESSMADTNEKLIKLAKAKIAEARTNAAKAESALAKSKATNKELVENLLACKEALKKYAKLGSLKAVTESLESLKAFKELAESPEYLKESLDKCAALVSKSKEYKKLAESIPEYEKALEQSKVVLEQYTSFGSIKNVKRAFETLEKVRNEELDRRMSNLITECSKRTGISLEDVRKIAEQAKDYKAAVEALSTIPAKQNAELLNESDTKVNVPGIKRIKEQHANTKHEGSIAARLVENMLSKQKRLEASEASSNNIVDI